MVETVDRVVHRVVDLRLNDRLRQRDIHLLQQGFQRLIADLLGLLHPLPRRTWSVRLSFSSSMVSNSLASWANSSSGSGSSRSFTDWTVTVTCASWPACSPATSFVVNTRVSPADSPTIASSRPSISWPEPTSWDSPSVAASGTSFAVDGGRQVN